jgi:hypothetical protein
MGDDDWQLREGHAVLAALMVEHFVRFPEVG